MEYILNKLVLDADSCYIHTAEGPDDASSHTKSSLIGPSITIPITRSRLNLGTWQGIYLLEFREYKSPRHVIATITGVWEKLFIERKLKAVSDYYREVE